MLSQTVRFGAMFSVNICMSEQIPGVLLSFACEENAVVQVVCTIGGYAVLPLAGVEPGRHEVLDIERHGDELHLWLLARVPTPLVGGTWAPSQVGG